MSNGNASEQVERIFEEPWTFLLPAIIVSTLVLAATIAAAVVVKIWWIGPIGLLAYIYVYLRKKRRNRFIITNRRFIRELYNPHHSIIAVPLDQIVEVKLTSRATDKVGSVQIRTTPAFGDQLLIDGERELGVIDCRRIPGHANFREILVGAVETAASQG